MENFTLSTMDIDRLYALVNGDAVGEAVPGVRNLSGRGNNLLNPTFGQADTPFIRLTESRYAAHGETDQTTGNRGINPIFADLDPRAISNLVGAQEQGQLRAASGANTLFTAFGQYFDHGLDFIKKGGSGTIEIGGAGINFAPSSNNPADLTRATVSGFDAAGDPVHINNTAAFVDQNQAYGSNVLVGIFLREPDGVGGVGSHLSMGAEDPSAPGYYLLPTLRQLIAEHWGNDTRFHVDGGTTTFRTYYAGLVDADGRIDSAIVAGMARDFMGSGQPLLLDTNPYINLLDHVVSGDGRVNENISLTAMHTIWARNHNFHVDNLLASGFSGGEHALFEAAKIINEAEYQRVVFTEFAETLLGGMRGLGSHGWNGYQADTNVAISEEFASAAYRFGHSMVGDTLRLMTASGTTRDVQLLDAFLNPSNEASVFTAPIELLRSYGYDPQPGYAQIGVGSILGGISRQAAEEVDGQVVDAVRNDLVRQPADLFSFNVARGRDVGLGTLNQVRAQLSASTDRYVSEAVGFAGNLSPYGSWEDFQIRNGLSDKVVSQLRLAYPDLTLTGPDEIAAFVSANPDIALRPGNVVAGIDRLDLWLGGMLESHVNGGVVGQTFWVILHEQLDRLQEGDRFYYLDRLDDFELYNVNIDADTFGFATIVERNTGEAIAGNDAFHVPWKVNTAPVIDRGVADRQIVETQAFSFTVPADAFRERDDGDTLIWEATLASGEALPSWLHFDPASRTFSGAPPVSQSQATPISISITVTVVDTFNAAASDTFDLIIQPYLNRIMGTPGANKLVGTSRPDLIMGLDGADKIDGRAGDDLLDGGGGNDDLAGGDGADLLTGGTGDDKLSGGAGSDALRGEDGRDTISGGDGDDIIIGGAAADQLTGGLGSDIFVFEKASDAPRRVGSSARDGITDFDAAADRIDLSMIDANSNVTGDQDFDFIGASSFTREAGQVRYASGILAGDTNGDGIADFEIQLSTRPILTADSLIL